MTVRPIIPSGGIEIDRLVRAHPFKPYRHYRAYSRKAQTAILQAEIESAVALTPALTFHAEDAGHEAVVVARPLPWDSEFFGVRMARIDYVVTSADAPASLIEAALEGTLSACRETSIPHVTARVDVEDIPAVHVLVGRGFRLMDALVTYRIKPQEDHGAAVRTVGLHRDFEQTDAEEVLDIAREAFRGYVGRFQHDPHVPADRAEEFYLEWTRACIAGAMADKRFVSVNSSGRVIGYLFFRRREPVSTVGGVPLHGGGIGACRRSEPGAYAGLIRAATAWSHEHGAISECQTQNYNFTVIRVYEAAGGHYVRAEYTLHAWLGDRAQEPSFMGGGR